MEMIDQSFVDIDFMRSSKLIYVFQLQCTIVWESMVVTLCGVKPIAMLWSNSGGAKGGVNDLCRKAKAIRCRTTTMGKLSGEQVAVTWRK